MAHCTRCGVALKPDARFCTGCGAPAGAGPIPQRPPAGSLRASVANVGLRLSSQQLVGFGVAVVAGVIMARILPYVYPVLSPILDAIFGATATSGRDNFNAFMMTALTFLTSFVIAYQVFKKPRRS